MAIAASDLTLRLKKLLKTSYPDYIVDVTASDVLWKDGSKMPLDKPDIGVVDLKELEEDDEVAAIATATATATAATTLNASSTPVTITAATATIAAPKLDNPTLRDQLSVPYQPGRTFQLDRHKESGRIRYMPFFQKLYGQTKKEVEENLVEIPWLPKTFGPNSKIKVTKINQVAEKLTKISEELDKLSPTLKEFLKDPGGTFSWRFIAGTKRLSAHSFGMTIDINVEHSHYWNWDYTGAVGETTPEKDVDYSKFPAYQNKIPFEIVEIFEKYNFIWGGKWFHYDTMHFEYRPELFVTDLAVAATVSAAANPAVIHDKTAAVTAAAVSAKK